MCTDVSVLGVCRCIAIGVYFARIIKLSLIVTATNWALVI